MDVMNAVSEDTDRSVSSAHAPLRAAILAYSVGSYAVGVAALVVLILLLLGVLPFGRGPVHVERPLLAGLLDLGLLLAFAGQHSVMARAGFKERWTRLIHPAMERSSYVLATGVVLLPVLALWQPLPTVLWSVGAPLARGAVLGIAVLGWTYLFLATFAINHLELFGLEQAWRAFRGRAPRPVPFRERWMYRFDRHPIMTGLLLGLWATPTLTVGRLLLAAGLTAYVVTGVTFEERALRRQWGRTYEDYRRRVGTIVPLPWSR
jgi:methanethiol S-methyltransferase